MLNIAICDDILEELEMISSIVSRSLKVIGIQFKISSFTDGQDIIECINSSKQLYDIIFLDIYMKTSNGIDIAKKIRKFDKECKIIFITSSKEHAIDSYDVNAFYYILKPINEEKLINTINKAVESLDKENKQIIIKNKKGNYRILYKDILYAESKARVIDIHLKSGEVISFYSKLDDFIEYLNDERFLKCHKSFVVNMNYILKMESSSIFIYNNITIPISNSKMAIIKEKYFKYLLMDF